MGRNVPNDIRTVPSQEILLPAVRAGLLDLVLDPVGGIARSGAKRMAGQYPTTIFTSKVTNIEAHAVNREGGKDRRDVRVEL